MQGSPLSLLSGTYADAAKGNPAASTTCVDRRSEDDGLLSLVGACSPEDMQDDSAIKSTPCASPPPEEEEGPSLSGLFSCRQLFCSHSAILSACCGVLLVLVGVLFIVCRMSGDIGGPLAFSHLINPDMLAGGPFTRSSAAFFTLWRHYYSFYFPADERLDSAGKSQEEDLYVLSGNDTECRFQVEAAGSRTDTASFSFPLPIPRPENRAGFSLPSDTSLVDLKREMSPTRDDEITWDKEEEEYRAHRGLQQMRSDVSLVSNRKRPQSIASLRVSQLCANRIHSSFSSTIVMGLWRLPAPALHSTKTVKRYMQQFRLGLELFAKHAIVVFANSDYLPLVLEAVQEAAARESAEATVPPLVHSESLLNHVCVVPLELWELPYASIGSHVRLAASAAIRDPRVLIDWWNHPYFNEGYHVLQLSKFGLTAEVALVNPFNSLFILWTDPPKRKYFPVGSAAIDMFLDGSFLSSNVKKGALLMQATPQRIQEGPWNAQCHKGVFNMHAKYAPGLAGGLFGGTPFAFSRVLPVWDAAARALLSLMILNDEQHLHTLVACSFPSLFHIIPYHPNCSPHFLCGSRTLAEVHPKAEVSFDLQGRQLAGPLPKTVWGKYPFPVSTSLDIPEALYVNAEAREEQQNASG
ncbi:hypothetical protein Esti_004316 [Eimeria stiedai]